MMLVIDIETFYDAEYTLKKMTTEAYIRDPRFKIHCIAIITPTEKKVFTNNFRENLLPYMDDFVVAQHSQFDGLILSHHLGLYPKYWGCTLSMARQQLQNLKSYSLESLAKHFCLPQKIIDYNAFKGMWDLDSPTMSMLTEGCIRDAELTYKIAEILLDGIPPEDLFIIDQTIRAFTEPALELDIPLVAEELERIKKTKAEALERLNVTREQLQSSAKFAELLIAQGVEVPTKYSEKQKKAIPALAKTDEGMKALLEHESETVAALAAARLGEKSTLMETRCERLLGMASRGPLPVYLKYHGAHTGRWSGGDKVNFQNFTRGSVIRKAIMAPEGYKLVGVDSAQIECRLLNWFAGQTDIVEAFRVGRDIYCENATKFFGREITKKNNPDERNFGKEIELASGYQMGKFKFQIRCKQKFNKVLTEEESARAIHIYRDSHPKVVKTWYKFNDAIAAMGQGLLPYKVGCVIIDGYRIIMPDGTFLNYEGLYYDGEEYKIGGNKVYGGLVTENVIQKLALLVIKDVLLRVNDKYGYKLATTTHDEVLYVVPEDDEKALDNVITEMKIAPQWCKDAPLGAEGFESERYDK